MRHHLLLATVLTVSGFAAFAPMAGAEVLRCADAAGNVSYTDSACPAGSKAMGRVTLQEPVTVNPSDADSRRQPQDDAAAARAGQQQQRRDAAQAAAPQFPAAPAGPAVIDSRGSSIDNDPRTSQSRWSDRGVDDPGLVDPGYAWPGVNAPAQRPRDMRPRIRNCDAGGCTDRQGNVWNNSGQLDRFRSIDGRTCRPVGTTTVCN